MFDLLCRDSLTWLSLQPDKSISNIVTAFPNKDDTMTDEEYIKWIYELVNSIFNKIDPEGFVIILIGDSDNIDKSYLITNTVYQRGFKILWSKIVGNNQTYTNMICYSNQGAIEPVYNDRIPVSKHTDADGKPLDSIDLCCLFVKENSKILGKNKYDIVDPFLGNASTILYSLVNSLDVIGIDRNHEKIKKIRKILRKAGY